MDRLLVFRKKLNIFLLWEQRLILENRMRPLTFVYMVIRMLNKTCLLIWMPL